MSATPTPRRWALLAAGLAGHGAWVLGPWAQQQISSGSALAATGAVALACVGHARWRHPAWLILGVPAGWLWAAPAVWLGPPAWSALLASAAWLAVALPGARPVDPDAALDLAWITVARPLPARRLVPAWVAGWALAAVAAAAVSAGGQAAAAVAWAPAPGRALAGVTAVGIGAGLVFAAGCAAPTPPRWASRPVAVAWAAAVAGALALVWGLAP